MSKQAKTLNERELQRVLDYAAKTKFAKRNRAILLLTHLAGMRIGEVAAVRICDILANDGAVRDEINLSQRSAAFSANSLTQIVNGIYKQAGVDGASSHSGRRTFLTNLAEKGVSVRVMMALAGHRNMATTQRYIDLRPGVLRNAVELL